MNGARVLIIGGTGTLGQEIIKQLGPEARVTCLSRCELKQKELHAKFPHVTCVLGDVRDRSSIRRPITDSHIVFHVAALKHIDILEANPEESVKTNILGTMNVASLARDAHIPVVFSSTDKAISPINVYGMCKGISEQIMLKNGHKVYRWGNVTGSRGSAIHYFVAQIKAGQPVSLTHERMTRFWIRIEEAVKFMIDTFPTAKGVMIPNMKAASVERLIIAIARLLGKTPEIVVTGLRPGEKIAEFITPELSSDNANQFTDRELEALVEPFL